MEGVESAISRLVDDYLEPGLYLVSTPIGNLGDITLRALSVLERANVIYCEDTRHSRKLLSRFGIKGALKTYHEHNASRERPAIIGRISKGESVVLISDAGTPLVSDPGYKLVREVQQAGLRLTSVPGPSAPVCALTISGLPTDRFYFEGFLPSKVSQRRSRLQLIADISVTMVFLESANRLTEMLGDLREVFGERRCVVARELTKKFEEVLSGDISDLISRCEQQKLRGEIVVLVAGKEAEELSREFVEQLLLEAMQQSSLSRAVKDIAERHGLRRNFVYDIGLALKLQGSDENGKQMETIDPDSVHSSGERKNADNDDL